MWRVGGFTADILRPVADLGVGGVVVEVETRRAGHEHGSQSHTLVVQAAVVGMGQKYSIVALVANGLNLISSSCSS